jgi:hypothetical protein
VSRAHDSGTGPSFVREKAKKLASAWVVRPSELVGELARVVKPCPSVEDVAEASDGFGGSLAAGDFNGDGRDDLAVSVPFEALNDVFGVIPGAGAVNAIYGASTGLSATAVSDQFWTQVYAPQ